MTIGIDKSRSGFTLLELIIVILIIGVVMSVGIPRIFNGLESAKSRNLLSDIIIFFRQTRMDALSTSKPVKVIIKLHEGVFETDNDKTFNIPEDSGILIKLINDDEYEYYDDDLDKTNVTFYPNGMATERKLVLSNNNSDFAIITIDPLTGLANYSTDFEDD